MSADSVSKRFQGRVNSFIEAMPDQTAEMRLTDCFRGVFDDKIFSVLETAYFLKMVDSEIRDVTLHKKFANAIPSHILATIFSSENDQNREAFDDISEELCAHLALRYCRENYLDATDTRYLMDDFEINSSDLRYRFASQMAQRDALDLCDEISGYDLDSDSLEKLMEKILYNNPDDLLTHLSEFDYEDHTDFVVRLYLKGIMRSVQVVDMLLESDFFLELLSDFSEDKLRFLYQTCGFGKKEILERQGVETLPEDEMKAAFVLSIRGDDPADFVRDLSDKEKFGLIASLLFLFLIEEDHLNNPSIKKFLKDIQSFNDQTTRFAAVALVSELCPMYDSVGHQNENENSGFFSIVIHSLQHLGLEPPKTIETKWKDKNFRKAILRFLAELFSAYKLNDSKRKGILDRFLEMDFDTLNAGSVCLARRFVKPLISGENPLKILEATVEKSWNRLGSPYNCTLNTELFSKLEWIQEIGDYIQSIERLVEDERGPMVRCFYQFLRLSAEGKMRDARYETPEVKKLFESIDLEVWRKETDHSVAELYQEYGQKGVPGDSPALDLRQALAESFEDEHISSDEYQAFYQGVFEGTSKIEDFILKEEILRELTCDLANRIKKDLDLDWIRNLGSKERQDVCKKMKEEVEKEPAKSAQEKIIKAIQDAVIQSIYPEVLKEVTNDASSTTKETNKNGDGLLKKMRGNICKQVMQILQEESELRKKIASHLLAILVAEGAKGFQKETAIGQLMRIFSKKTEFWNDLKLWDKSLKAEAQRSKREEDYMQYRIIKSDDPYTLFRVGSIAGETCQRVNGDPAYNKCLLAYPCDGKNQVVYAQDSNGEIKARAILRFFYAADDFFKHLFPVALLEPIYPPGVDPVLRKAIMLSAFQCTEKLGVTLLRKKTKEEDKSFDHGIVTIGGPAPFEYFDVMPPKLKIVVKESYRMLKGSSLTTIDFRT